jgi:hypothetical protein
MKASAAASGVLALALAGTLAIAPATAAPTAAPVQAQFDTDEFQLSSGGSSASGAVYWTRRGRAITGRVSGSVDGGKCLRVTWLNSANNSIGGANACGGFSTSYSSPSLQCVLLRLGSASRQLCAGGS